MANYINADHLKVEIEKHIKEVKDAEKRFTPNMGFFDAKLSGIYDVMALIDSLQQEKPEVDLEKEIRSMWKKCEPTDEGMGVESTYMHIEAFDIIARYFYELGLNAKKIE